MAWVLISIVLFGIVLRAHALTYLAENTVMVHRVCLSMAPSSIFRPLYQSAVCGHRLGHDTASQIWAEGGGVHLIVSQGLHLTLILGALSWSRIRGWPLAAIRAVTILIFSAVLGFHPLICRAALNLAANEASRRLRLNWNGAQRVAIASAACLALESSFWTSHSLQLAWTGCIALQFARRPLARCAIAFAATAPLIASHHALNPLAIACSWALGPVFAVALFPAAIASFANARLVPFADAAWAAATRLLDEVSRSAAIEPHGQFAVSSFSALDFEFWRWGYVFALTAFALARAREPAP